MTRNFPSMVLALLFALCAAPALSQQEPEPGKDHPSVPRFPGMVMSAGTETDFNGFDFQISADEKTQRVEGKSWEYEYNLKEGARHPSPLEVVRNYANQFTSRGGKVMYQASDNSVTTMKMPLGAGERWMRLQTNGDAVIMLIIESGLMQQKVEFSADEMAAQAAATGKIVLHGILFDTAKTTIRAESNSVLDEVATLMKRDTGLRFRIEGHTDNVGAKAVNLTLSKGRAASVKTALVARGLAAGRLSSEGQGDSQPAADNGTEEGRRQNRRVELVKQ